MAETFPFKLITPTGVVMDQHVEEVIARSVLGEFGVLPNHINFLTSLIPCVLRVKTGGGAEVAYVIMGGMAEVKDGKMTVLAPEVESPENLDRAQATREESKAEQRLGQTSYYAQEYAEAEYALQVAQARQQATDLARPSR